MLQLLRNLRSHSQSKKGKEITDVDILNWANSKVKKVGRTSQMESFKVKSEQWPCITISFKPEFGFLTLFFFKFYFNLVFRIKNFRVGSSSSSFLVLLSQGW